MVKKKQMGLVKKNIRPKVRTRIKDKMQKLRQKRLEKKMKKLQFVGRKNLKQHFFFLPSLITCGSILCGLWAIFLCFTTGNIEASIILIVAAAVLDAFDGRVARFLGVSSNFGVELDSLADFLSFGVAPMIVYFHAFSWDKEMHTYAILSMFPICMALRLARFNMLALEPVKDRKMVDFRKNFFFGLAAPVGAIVLMMPILADIMGYWGFACTNCALFYAFVVALFLVIPVPIFSHKMFHFGFKKMANATFTTFVILLAIYLIYCPLCCIFTVTLVYAMTIPISIFVYNKGIAKLEAE